MGASWLGAMVEHLNSSIKLCLKKIFLRSVLNHEEMITQIQCIIKNRPITFTDDNIDDSLLTPNRLLFKALAGVILKFFFVVQPWWSTFLISPRTIKKVPMPCCNNVIKQGQMHLHNIYWNSEAEKLMYIIRIVHLCESHQVIMCLNILILILKVLTKPNF